MTAGSLLASLLTPAEAEALAEPWRRLGEAAIEPNVFYGPEIALAGLRHIPGGRRMRIAAAWRERDGGRDLVGILPVERGGLRYGNPGPIRRGPTFFATLSTPLLAPDAPEDTMEAMLLALGRAGIAAVALPYLPDEGPVAGVLRRLSAERGFALAILERHQRALLRGGQDGASYLRGLFKAPARNKHERQRKKLAEFGPVRTETASGGEDLDRALAGFLALEAAGWKGEAGTALAIVPGGAAFIRDAMAALGRSGHGQVMTLKAGERPVAALLVLAAQRRAYLLKIAYDETLSRSSPGVLLALDATARILDDPAFDDADSLAAAGHPMIDRIWAERVAIASVVVATAPGRPSRRFRLAVAIERLRERAVARIKVMRRTESRSEAGAPAP